MRSNGHAAAFCVASQGPAAQTVRRSAFDASLAGPPLLGPTRDATRRPHSRGTLSAERDVFSMRFFVPSLSTLLLASFALACAAAGPQAQPVATPDALTTSATPPRAGTPPDEDQPTLPAPDWLPDEAREVLRSRMQRHGEEMMLLLVSVMTLQHGDTEILAEHIAAEPRLGRPVKGETGTISAMLPSRFFELQDELEVRAHAMAEVARTSDPSRIVRAYGQLAETCVSCHSVYLDAEGRADLPGD
ncbi:MAG: hypothetical protein RL033_2681 [Pseudomonadota bacterium]